MRFLGLDFAGRVPDAKTVWYFRDQLQQRGLVKQLFDRMNSDLERRGIIANHGQIVDATFVEAPRQRNSRADNSTIKAGGVPADWQDNPARLQQKDTDARWTKKNKETHYGYKNHVICDSKSKLLTDYKVTDAAVHDSVPLVDLLAGGCADGQKLYADSAYRSEAIEESLRDREIESKIHEKAYRNQPLKPVQQKRNTAKSKVRARVEHIFGFMTQSMGGLTVRGCSLSRNKAVIGLMNIVYNMCRLVQLNRKIVGSMA